MNKKDQDFNTFWLMRQYTASRHRRADIEWENIKVELAIKSCLQAMKNEELHECAHLPNQKQIAVPVNLCADAESAVDSVPSLSEDTQ